MLGLRWHGLMYVTADSTPKTAQSQAQQAFEEDARVLQA